MKNKNTGPKVEEMEQQLSIELPDEISEGIYSNLAVISHSNMEFVMDFILMVPNVPKAKVKSRIILTPQNARRLLGALSENIERYENQFGPISDTQMANFIAPMNFTTPGEA